MTQGAPKGNQYWRLRKVNAARPRKFKDGHTLWKACVDYFEWVIENPLIETKVGWFQGDATDHEVDKMRAMTITGLCLHLGTNEFNWRRWRDKDRDDNGEPILWGYAYVCGMVDGIIYEQKLTGAAADLLNPVIIARELGLQDHQKRVNIDVPIPELNDADATKAYLAAINSDD